MKQLFRKILNPFARPESGFPARPLVENMVGRRRSVPDLFRIDLNNLPLHEFSEGKIEVNPNGDMIRTYFKSLDYKECGVFDQVWVKLTGSKSVNVIFKCSEPEMVDNEKLRLVIDSLYDIYGQDNNNRGLLSLTPPGGHDQQFYLLFGRNWMDYPRFKHPVSVRRYSEDVFISVWGFTHQPEMTVGS
jgi:hypothetical protein